MRDKNRIPIIIELLEEEWKKQPDLRFGQFVWNLYNEYFNGIDMFYVEDKDLLKLLLKKENNE
jgi:uncharacterized protein YihD (DUF1040 family)